MVSDASYFAKWIGTEFDGGLGDEDLNLDGRTLVHSATTTQSNMDELCTTNANRRQ